MLGDALVCLVGGEVVGDPCCEGGPVVVGDDPLGVLGDETELGDPIGVCHCSRVPFKATFVLGMTRPATRRRPVWVR